MLTLPYFKQETPYDCGAASLQMICAYFGKTKNQHELSARLGSGPEIWVPNEKLEAVAKEEGFFTQCKIMATFDDLTQYIDAKIPTIINYLDSENHEGHFAVVIDVTNTHVVLNDPWYGKEFQLTRDYLADHWYSFEGDRPQWVLAISDKPFTY